MLSTSSLRGLMIRATAKDGQYLLCSTLAEAANWIDQNLPLPPNPDLLSGFNDPPPIPSNFEATLAPSAPLASGKVDELSSESVSHSPVLDHFNPSVAQEASSSDLDSPRSRSSSPQVARSSLLSPSPQHKRTSQSPAPLPLNSNRTLAFSPSPPRPRLPPSLVSEAMSPPRSSPFSSTTRTSIDRLTLGNLPLGFRSIDVQELFAIIGVDCKVLICHTSFSPTYAYVDVAQSQTGLCVKLLDQKRVQNFTIWCQVARSTEKTKQPRKRSKIDPDDNFPLPLPPVSQPPSSPSSFRPSSDESSHNLLMLNLPLNHSLEVLAILQNLPPHELHRLEDQDQSVVFMRVDSSDSATSLIDLWHNFSIDGRRVQFKYAKVGLKGIEAIRDQFGATNDSKPKSAFTSTSNRRKKLRRSLSVRSSKELETSGWKEREEDWKRAQGGRTGGPWGEWDLV